MIFCRRVTLTEIEEGKEWNWPNPENIDEQVFFNNHLVQKYKQ